MVSLATSMLISKLRRGPKIARSPKGSISDNRKSTKMTTLSTYKRKNAYSISKVTWIQITSTTRCSIFLSIRKARFPYSWAERSFLGPRILHLWKIPATSHKLVKPRVSWPTKRSKMTIALTSSKLCLTAYFCRISTSPCW